MKIIGPTVGTTLPKPDLSQIDPKKGDYVKGKAEFLEQVNSGATAEQITNAVASYLKENPPEVDMSGYMKETELDTAIDTALAQAKESGAFDGKDGEDGQDGYTPVKGKDYFDGEDGYTPVKGKDYFDGKDGKDGENGKTPVRGKDYWTEADKAEIKSYVDEAILGGAW